MDKKVVLCFLYLSVFCFSQNTSFIIGADWLSPVDDSYYNASTELSTAYWDSIKAFGLNFGEISKNYQFPTTIQAELSHAKCRGIQIQLHTRAYPIAGATFIYQIENNDQFDSNHTKGNNLYQSGSQAQTYWRYTPNSGSHPNYKQLIAGDSGIVVKNPTDQLDTLPDNVSYYIRFHLRYTSLPPIPPADHLNFLTLMLTNSSNDTVYTGNVFLDAFCHSLSINTWGDYTLPVQFQRQQPCRRDIFLYFTFGKLSFDNKDVAR